MIISCEKCRASYMVPDSAIGASGRIVKCAKCGHNWMATLPPSLLNNNIVLQKDSSNHNSNSKIDANVKLPSVVNKKTPFLNYFTYSLAILSVLSMLFFNQVSMMEYFPFSSQLFRGTGVFSTQFMQLASVNFKKQQINGINHIIIDGNIIKPRAVGYLPLLKISVKNKDNKLLIYSLVNLKDEHFNQTITNLPTDGEYIHIDIGNWFELMWR